MALVLLALSVGCSRSPLHAFEPPPAGASFTTRDHELHVRLSDALHECERALLRRQREDRIDRVLRVLYVLLASFLGGMAASRFGLPEPGLVSTPCARDRVAGLEDECVLQFVPNLHRGPIYDGRDGTFEDSPRAGLDLRADVQAALDVVDAALEARVLDTLSIEDRERVLRAIVELGSVCD